VFLSIQAISTISHISFAEEESISPKKPTSIAEVAKQRELSGTLLSEDDSKMKKQISDLKSKELSGHDIFAPPEDPQPRNSENGSTSQTPGKNAYVLISQPVSFITQLHKSSVPYCLFVVRPTGKQLQVW